MKKYFEAAKILFKAQIVYRFDVGMKMLATILRVLFAWILWGAMFGTHETIGGFTFQSMLMYYVVSSFITTIDSSGGIIGEVSGHIRGGTFSKFMVIPVSPQIYFIAQSFGTSGYYSIFAVVATVFSVIVFGVHPMFTVNFLSIACAVLMILMGLVFMVSYHYFIGILTFKFMESGFFEHVQSSVLAFLTGSVIPLTLLPSGVLSVLKFLPFTYVAYKPAMLITGQSDNNDALFGLTVLACWTVGMMLINEMTYKRLRIKYDGVGI